MNVLVWLVSPASLIPVNGLGMRSEYVMFTITVPLYNAYATIDLQADSLLISMLDNTYPQL